MTSTYHTVPYLSLYQEQLQFMQIFTSKTLLNLGHSMLSLCWRPLSTYFLISNINLTIQTLWSIPKHAYTLQLEKWTHLHKKQHRTLHWLQELKKKKRNAKLQLMSCTRGSANTHWQIPLHTKHSPPSPIHCTKHIKLPSGILEGNHERNSCSITGWFDQSLSKTIILHRK